MRVPLVLPHAAIVTPSEGRSEPHTGWSELFALCGSSTGREPPTAPLGLRVRRGGPSGSE